MELPADFLSLGRGSVKLVSAQLVPTVRIRPKRVQKLTSLLPRDYCLIPSNGSINLLI